MAKKGRVVKMTSHSQKKPKKKVKLSDEHSFKVKFDVSQDHFQHYSELIKRELSDESELVEDRLKKWPKSKLQNHGVALFDLNCRSQGRIYGDPILVFDSSNRQPLPDHNFSHGDIVIISRGNPLDHSAIEGIVLDKRRNRLRIVVSEKPKGLKKGSWRLDKGANRVAFDRMNDSLIRFHSSENEYGTSLRDLLIGLTHDPAYSASSPPEISGKKKKHNIDFDDLPLNDSQKLAVLNSIDRKISLIQGPPGTGKTHTSIQLLKVISEMERGPILASAASNVAVDNLLEGLVNNGVNAIRIGRPVKVRESLRDSTLDAKMEAHPLAQDLEFIEKEFQQLMKKLPSLRGKEKGMAHKEISRCKKDRMDIEKNMIKSILDSADVICATTIGSGHKILGNRRFPVVLIDEATQATEPSTLVPICRGTRQLILVGDHAQLSPTVISEEAEAKGLGFTLFERLHKLGIESTMLTTQYRMHPTIREFPSSRFYENRLEDGCSKNERVAPAGFIWPDWDKPVAFIPQTGEDSADFEGNSRCNRDEAGVVLQVAQELLGPGDLQAGDIGIITPYNGQVRLLKNLFEEASTINPNLGLSDIEIKSVDGYQGREKEVIIFSCVRSNSEGNLGFLKDKRRLNVAITRPKRGLIITGNPTTLRHDPTWAAWIDWMEESGLMAWHIGQ